MVSVSIDSVPEELGKGDYRPSHLRYVSQVIVLDLDLERFRGHGPP
jgi:hypothetical protein